MDQQTFDNLVQLKILENDLLIAVMDYKVKKENNDDCISQINRINMLYDEIKRLQQNP